MCYPQAGKKQQNRGQPKKTVGHKQNPKGGPSAKDTSKMVGIVGTSKQGGPSWIHNRASDGTKDSKLMSQKEAAKRE